MLAKFALIVPLLLALNSQAEVITKKISKWCESSDSITIKGYENLGFWWSIGSSTEECSVINGAEMCVTVIQSMYAYPDMTGTTKTASVKAKSVRKITDAASLNFSAETIKTSPSRILVFKDELTGIYSAFKTKGATQPENCPFEKIALSGTLYIQTDGSGDFSK